MRILLTIHADLNPNAGAPGVILRLRDEFQKAGHLVDVFAFDRIRAKVGPQSRTAILPWLLASYLRKCGNQYDVIDAGSGDAWLAFDLPLAASTLRVTHSHGLEPLLARAEIEYARNRGQRIRMRTRLWSYGARLHMVRRSLKRSDLCLVLHAGERIYLRDTLGIDNRKIDIAKQAADDTIIDQPISSHSPERGFGIIQIGSYIERKGIRASASAMNRLLIKHRAIKFCLLGTGVTESKVRADFVPEVQSQLTVIPEFNNARLPELLAGFHVHLMPSIFEGYPIVKIEAMARGLVPVVSDDPGSACDVENRKNGLVVARDDDVALEKALEFLFTNRGDMLEMRTRALQSVSNMRWNVAAKLRIESYVRAFELKGVESPKLK